MASKLAEQTAQKIYDALAVNDDINSWHKEGILPMVTAIVASAIATERENIAIVIAKAVRNTGGFHSPIYEAFESLMDERDDDGSDVALDEFIQVVAAPIRNQSGETQDGNSE